MIMNTAPPATHNHGDEYHSVVVFVVVLVLVVTWSLACAQRMTCIQVNRKARKNLYPHRRLIFFMINFLIKKLLSLTNIDKNQAKIFKRPLCGYKACSGE